MMPLTAPFLSFINANTQGKFAFDSLLIFNGILSLGPFNTLRSLSIG